MFEKDDIILSAIDAFKLHFENDYNYIENRRFVALSVRLNVTDYTEIKTKNNTYFLKTGDICIFPPRISYSRTTKCEDMIVFHFFADNIYSDEPIVIHNASQKIINLFVKGFIGARKKQKGCKFFLNSVIYEILYELCTPKYSENLEKAIAYIQDNYCSPEFSIDNLCKHINISSGYLRKLFYKELNTSPKKFSDDLRFDRAIRLLQTEYISVTDVANLIGFSDPKNFATAFKKRYGFSPKKSRFLE